jgi:transcriptional regulator with XRE-family HTH domain
MDIKEVVKTNKITQQEFADFMGYSRQSLSGTLRDGKERKSLINNLKLILLEKRGVSIDLAI